MMKIRDKLSALQADRLLWSIHPATLAQLRAKMEQEAWLEEEDDDTPPQPQSLLTVIDGVGVIPITGTLMSENHWLFKWFGETSYEGVQRAAADAASRSDVVAVKTVTDSPGGLVAGAHGASESMRQLAAVKPVLAYNANQMTSAAYWLNTHATHIVSTPTGFTGSIGVATVHREISGLEKRIGIKSTDIASGDLKRIGSFYEPLTDEARDYLRQQCVDCAQVFVDDVASARRMTPAQQAEIARAGTYLGSQAVKLGLVNSTGLDGHATDILNSLREAKRSFIDLGRNSTTSRGGEDMATAEELQAAQKAERKRIADIRALAPVGMESFVDSLALDERGLTVEQAAVEILAEQRKNPPKPAQPAANAAPAQPATPAAGETTALNQFLSEGTPPLKVQGKEPATNVKATEDTIWDTAYDVAIERLNKTDARGSLGSVRD